MIVQFDLLLIIIHGLAALTISHDNSEAVYNNSPSTTAPSFTAIIFDKNNNDITSSFQILLYSQGQQNSTAPPISTPNSTSWPLHRRRVLNRLLTMCHGPEQFISSHCNPVDGNPGSLQAYTVVCRHGAMGGPPTARGRNSLTRRQGSCEPNEICVDTTSRVGFANPRNRYRANVRTIIVPTAMCVTDDAFEPTGPDWESESVAAFWAAAAGLTSDAPLVVRAALSRYDKTTPMEVDRLEMVGQALSSGEERQEQAICRDCVGLGMKVEGALEGLKVEARLLTTLQMGLTGVLWLTAMSG